MRTLVSNPSTPPALSSIYIPQCSASGQWSPVQCDGPPEQAFEWYERWEAQNSAGQALTLAELLMKIMSYKAEVSLLSSQPKANFPNSFISNQGDSLASATFFHLYLRGSEMKGGGCFLKPQSQSSTVSSMH